MGGRPRPHALGTAPGLPTPALTSQLLPKTALEPPPLLAKPQHALSPHQTPALLPSLTTALEPPLLPAKPQHALSPPHPPALPLSLKDALVRPRPTALETAPGTTVLAHEQ